MRTKDTAKTVRRTAYRVRLAWTVEPVARELYGVKNLVVDEKATLRRVALFYRGTGRYQLTPHERDAALEVIRERGENCPVE